MSLALNWYWGLTLYHARQYDQAIEQLRTTLQMEPNYHLAHGALVGVYEQKGMYAEALAEFKTAQKLREEPANASASAARIYALSGNRGEAQKRLNELKEMPQQFKTIPSDNQTFLIAGVYTALGEKDQAIDWLEKAYDQRAFGVFFLKVDPHFDSLRSDERFKDLLRRIGLKP